MEIEELESNFIKLGKSLDAYETFNPKLINSYVKYAKMARQLGKLYFDEVLNELEIDKHTKEAGNLFVESLKFEGVSNFVYSFLSGKFLLASDLDNKDEIDYTLAKDKLDEICDKIENEKCSEIKKLSEFAKSLNEAKTKLDDVQKKKQAKEIEQVSLKVARIANEINVHSFNMAIYSLFEQKEDPDEFIELSNNHAAARNMICVVWLEFDSILNNIENKTSLNQNA